MAFGVHRMGRFLLAMWQSRTKEDVVGAASWCEKCGLAGRRAIGTSSMKWVAGDVNLSGHGMEVGGGDAMPELALASEAW